MQLLLSQILMVYITIQLLFSNTLIGLSCSAVINVGLERTSYMVLEGVGSIEVCAAIFNTGQCTSGIPFVLIVNTTGGTAGWP